MQYLEWLERQFAVPAVEKRIGQPVALRAYLQVTSDHGLLLPVLTRAAVTASKWMRAPVSKLYAQGGVTAGYVTVLAEFAGGQTALLASETLRGEPPMVTLLLIGNHGTMRFDDQPRPVTEATGSAGLERAIQDSLRSGKPTAVRHAG